MHSVVTVCGMQGTGSVILLLGGVVSEFYRCHSAEVADRSDRQLIIFVLDGRVNPASEYIQYTYTFVTLHWVIIRQQQKLLSVMSVVGTARFRLNRNPVKISSVTVIQNKRGTVNAGGGAESLKNIP